MNNGKVADLGHILGIDFGTANIGLALADRETKMAFAYGVVKNDKNFWKKLEEIVAEENVEEIIIGVPGYAVGDGGNKGKQIFGKELKKRFAGEVFFAEEMFTTQSAHANLHEAQKKNVGKNDDAEAARIILQEWLDRIF